MLFRSKTQKLFNISSQNKKYTVIIVIFKGCICKDFKDEYDYHL